MTESGEEMGDSQGQAPIFEGIMKWRPEVDANQTAREFAEAS
jgi:hypothetical protein